MSFDGFKNPEFRNQAVRDLAWAISTPPIISSAVYPCRWPTSAWYQENYKDTLSWFRELDQDCSSLDSLLAQQKDRRLGKYFETLWFYWLSHHPRYDVLAHNLQIIIDGKTLGEIDFILFDKKNKKTLHWEMAVKFYLGIDDTRQMRNWHGPNLRDRLDLKVNHLLNKQSIVSKDNRIAEWLQKQGLVVDQCAVILKGRLYYHWSQFVDKKFVDKKSGHGKLDINKVSAEDAEKLVSEAMLTEREYILIRPEQVRSEQVQPEEATIDHLHSKWFRQSEFEVLFDRQQRFLPLINSGWLEGLPTGGMDEVISKDELFNALSDKKLWLPVHLQLYKGNVAGDRIFLVNETWSKTD